MKYKSEVPKSEQIHLNEFPLLPGDRAMLMDKEHAYYFYGIVREVGSANPEYVLRDRKKPMPKDAGVITWNENSRENCKQFLQGGHMPVAIRLKKSMWAVVEFTVETGKTPKKKLYTYDILKLKKDSKLLIIHKEKLE